MSRERERERDEEREGDGEKGGGEKRKKRERERGGKGRVMYTFCALFATMFPEKGGFRGDKFRYGNSRNTYKNNTIGKRT